MTSRHASEIRIRSSDPGRASPYISAARLLVGELLDEVSRTNIRSATRRRTLPDGTQLAASVMGDAVPIATITTPPRPTQAAPLPRPETLAGCVVTPRNTDYPDGQDGDRPEAILFGIEDPGPLWGALWHDSSVPGFSLTPQPRGTYGGGFSERLAGGNIDWRGPAGERLSWYGPASRYWYDPQDQNAFPKQWLFHAGQVLLDATAYSAEQEDAAISGGIAGASFWRGEDGQRWLHVIHLSGTTHTLVRYEIAASGLTFSIVGYAVIDTLSLADSHSPWFFNESGSAAVHMTDPENGSWIAPSAQDEGHIARLAISASGGASFSTAAHSLDVGQEGGTGPVILDQKEIAFDYQGDIEVSVSAAVTAKFMAHWALPSGSLIATTAQALSSSIADIGGNSTDISALAAAEFGEPFNPGYLSRRVIWMDLRSELSVFLHHAVGIHGELGDAVGYAHTIELVWRGQVVEAKQIALLDGPHPPVLNGVNMVTEGTAGGGPYTVSPRLRMFSYYDSITAPVFFSGWLASYGSQHSESPWRDSYERSGWGAGSAPDWYERSPTAPIYRPYGYEDARGHLHYVVGFVEQDHALVSVYAPVLRNTGTDGSGPPFTVESIDTDQAFNWMTFTTLPARLGTADGDAVFYPGWSFGRIG